MATTPETLRNVAYSLVIVVGVFATAEMVLAGRAPPRSVEAQIHESAMEPSPRLGWTPVRGESAPFGVPEPTFINDAGTRNPPFTPKAAGARRLLTLGDSTVFGVLVRDADVFGAVAARALSEGLGSPVEAINGGVPGYSSEQARRLYEAELRGVDADWVVIATLWSDAQDAQLPDSLAYVDHTDPLRSLLNRSATFRTLETVLSDRRNATEVKWTISPGQGHYRVMPAEYRANLHALADLARADGAEPVFLQLPSDRDLREQPLEVPRPTYRQIMAEVAEAEGAVFIDGAAPFRGQPASLLLDDVHPSAEGHALLGRTVAQALMP